MTDCSTFILHPRDRVSSLLDEIAVKRQKNEPLTGVALKWAKAIKRAIRLFGRGLDKEVAWQTCYLKILTYADQLKDVTRTRYIYRMCACSLINESKKELNYTTRVYRPPAWLTFEQLVEVVRENEYDSPDSLRNSFRAYLIDNATSKKTRRYVELLLLLWSGAKISECLTLTGMSDHEFTYRFRPEIKNYVNEQYQRFECGRRIRNERRGNYVATFERNQLPCGMCAV